MIRVNLTMLERRVAVTAGAYIADRLTAVGAKPKGFGSAGHHSQGVAAEMAVAKWLGVYYEFDCRDDRLTGDVESWQVRSTTTVNGHLLVHEEDDSGAPFILVICRGGGVFDLAGWAYGADVKATGRWLAHLPYPAFGLAQDRLSAMEILDVRSRA